MQEEGRSKKKEGS